MLRRRIGDMFRAVANLIDPPRAMIVQTNSNYTLHVDGVTTNDRATYEKWERKHFGLGS